MHIKIEGFKIHLEVEFIFKNGEMTLLRSVSGGGKSTILQAIFWALYGNMRGIYNNTRITKKLSVYLSLPGITIFRKKNPDLLTVTLSDGKTYDDNTIAQSIIDNIYGHRELWKACSYIEQKSRCSLLSGTGGERMELLNALSFTGETPKEHISKITATLKEKTAEFERDQANFIHELNLYTKSISERTIKFLYSEDDISKISEKITDLDKSVTSKHEELLLQEQLLGTQNYLIDMEKELCEKNKILNCRKIDYPAIIVFNEPEIPVCNIPLAQNYSLDEKVIISYNDYSNMKTQYGNELKKYLEQISLEKEKKRLREEKIKLQEQRERERKKLEKELQELEVEINKNLNEHKNFKNVKQEDIWNASKLEIERGKNVDECRSIGLVYDENIIKNTINELSEQLKRYNLFDSQIVNYNKLVEIENKLSKFSDFSSVSITELERLQNEKSTLINDMKKGLELLSCPKCGVSLRYQNSVLSIGERDPVSKNDILLAEKDYLQLSEKIHKYREMTKLEENRDFISKTVDKMAIQEYINSNTKNKVSSLSALIHRISKIRYIPEITESSEMLTNIYNYQNLLRRRDNIKNNIKIIENVEVENVEISNEDYVQKYEHVSSLLRDVEEKYSQEQKRVLKNQEIVRKSQQLEAERLKALAKYEDDKKRREERRMRTEKENEEKLKKYSFELEALESEKKNLLSRIEENKQEIQRINSKIFPKIREEYFCLCKELEEEKAKYDDAIYTVKILKIAKDLEVKRESLLKLQNDVQALTNLRVKAVEVECKQLEDTVNNINTVLETTLPVFFNDPISLTLQLYKKLKTDVMKPGLNLEICYKGCKYDNINSLSGGEGDRISLALLLALNSVSNSPIILLDECVSSLDGDLKESCITAIKSIPNKTVICVDHDDALEGFYDSVIDI
jgi:exonuclease SbcC